MNESPFGIHHVKLIIQPLPCLRDGSCVRKGTDCSLHSCKICIWNNRGRLVVDAHFESRWTPFHEVDVWLLLDRGNGTINIFGNHISPVQETDWHVLSSCGVTLNHLIDWFEAFTCDVSHTALLMACLKSQMIFGLEAAFLYPHYLGLHFKKLGMIPF